MTIIRQLALTLIPGAALKLSVIQSDSSFSLRSTAVPSSWTRAWRAARSRTMLIGTSSGGLLCRNAFSGPFTLVSKRSPPAGSATRMPPSLNFVSAGRVV